MSFEMHLLFCSVTLSVDISADLTIWGPDLTGHADINLWFVSFGVDFGARAPRGPHAQSWSDSTFISDLVVPTTSSVQQTHQPHRLGAAAPSNPLQFVALSGLDTAAAGAGYDWIADPARTVIKIITALPAAHATLNGTLIPDIPAIALQAKPIANAPSIDPTLAITITSQEALDAWHPSAIIDGVPSALWQATSTTELTPGLTAVRLDIIPKSPDETLAIEQDLLLFNDEGDGDVPLSWQTPSVPPGGGFSWATDNPFETIKTASTPRAALLGAFAIAGYLDPAAIAGIDVDFVVPAQPCFMADPILCRLGADQLS